MVEFPLSLIHRLYPILPIKVAQPKSEPNSTKYSMVKGMGQSFKPPPPRSLYESQYIFLLQCYYYIILSCSHTGPGSVSKTPEVYNNTELCCLFAVVSTVHAAACKTLPITVATSALKQSEICLLNQPIRFIVPSWSIHAVPWPSLDGFANYGGWRPFRIKPVFCTYQMAVLGLEHLAKHVAWFAGETCYDSVFWKYLLAKDQFSVLRNLNLWLHCCIEIVLVN